MNIDDANIGDKVIVTPIGTEKPYKGTVIDKDALVKVKFQMTNDALDNSPMETKEVWFDASEMEPA